MVLKLHIITTIHVSLLVTRWLSFEFFRYMTKPTRGVQVIWMVTFFGRTLERWGPKEGTTAQKRNNRLLLRVLPKLLPALFSECFYNLLDWSF